MGKGLVSLYSTPSSVKASLGVTRLANCQIKPAGLGEESEAGGHCGFGTCSDEV